MVRRLSLYLSLLSLLLALGVSCSKVQVIRSTTSETGKSGYYRPVFTQKIEKIKALYKRGKSDQALSDLMTWDDPQFRADEQAFRLNLIGVIHFANKNYVNALENFTKAKKLSVKDRALEAQIDLNLASSNFKTEKIEAARTSVDAVLVDLLDQAEQAKYWKLRYYIYSKSDQREEIIKSLMHYLAQYHEKGKLLADPLYPQLQQLFKESDPLERAQFIKMALPNKSVLVPLLASDEIERTLFLGQQQEAVDLFEWTRGRYQDEQYAQEFLNLSQNRLQNQSRSGDLRRIGVILPLSGNKKSYAQDVIRGIEAYFNKSEDLAVELFFKDSQGNGEVGRQRVEELVIENNVGLIIGGLFPDEAAPEYREAQKRGVLFVSLAALYVPTAEKDSLLIEISGSIESQVDRLLAPDILTHFGNRIALFTPSDERGKAYAHYFWTKAQEVGAAVTTVNNYLANSDDYRDEVKRLLRVAFVRERADEVKNAVKGKESLAPVIDFNWIFIPAHPNEAVQIIPTFSFFDANRVVFFGPPSWRSKMLARFSDLQKIYFVGSDFEAIPESEALLFAQQYGHRPQLLEITGLEGAKVASEVLKGAPGAKSKAELVAALVNGKKIMGIIDQWELKNRLWIKQMGAFKFYKKEIEAIGSAPTPPSVKK